MGCSARAARPSVSLRAPVRASAPLPSRRPSRSARTGKLSAEAVKGTVCTRPRPRPRPAPPESSRATDLTHARECGNVFLEQFRQGGPRGSRPHVNHDVEGAALECVAMAPEDLSQPSPKTIADDGPSHAPRHRDPETRGGGRRTLEQIYLEKATRNTDAGCVALLEIPSFAKAVVAGERFPTDRT